MAYFADLQEFSQYCASHTPTAAALPLHWPGGESDAPLLDFLRTYGRRVAILVYAPTAQLRVEEYSRVLAAGARRVCDTAAAGFAEDLAYALRGLVQGCQARRAEEQELQEIFAQHGLIGRSAAMQEAFRRAVRACHFDDLPILILGETGTGKQRLAEAIHQLDPRRGPHPFVVINCGAISRSLAESELFGHTRGAFSGAERERAGLFRAAHGGTLLLDEVGELDLELQPKLLRVLQERRLLPVGADYEHAVDIRVVAATNRALEPMVAEGRFRSDLYQRLNVFRIHIPRLCERPEDIELQARHFLQHHSRPSQVNDFDPHVLDALQRCRWEGNTRQLENVIREILVNKQSGTLVQMEDLPRWLLERLAEPVPAAHDADLLDALHANGDARRGSLREAVEAFERRLLQAVLRRNAGNRTRTAAELGLTARSILNKIKKYHLE